MSSHQKPIELVTLGRPFRLGMLYDIRSDALIPGLTLWDSQKLKENTSKTDLASTNYEVITQDSLQAKAHVLGIDASMKLSVLGGLFSLSGSAKYADDRKQSNHQTRLTLQYSTTTAFEQLTMNLLGKGNLTYTDLHDADIATHVVTGVIYGAEAFFVFDRTLANTDHRTEVEGKLKVVFNKIPAFTVEGQANLNLNDSEKAMVDTLNCKFYGDFHLDKNPNTFAEAVDLYRKLPSLLGVEKQNAVPKRVYLYPLHLLDSKAARIVREISSSTVDYCVNLLDSLQSLVVKAKDLTTSSLFMRFSQMKELLLHFIDLLSTFERDLKSEMLALLPQVRGGGKQEAELLALFKGVDRSPFNCRKLSSWIADRETEIALLTSFVENLLEAGTHTDPLLISFGATSFAAVRGNLRSKLVICLLFRLNSVEEPQLTDMNNHLYQGETVASQTPKHSLPWFKIQKSAVRIRANVEQFIELARANAENDQLKFVVNEEYLTEGDSRVEIVLFENGWEKEGFIVSSKPGAPTAEAVTDSSVTLRWTDDQNGSDSVQQYKIMYQEKNGDVIQWNTQMTNDISKTVCISKLPSATTFLFKIQSISKVCRSPVSDTTEVSTTGESSIETCSVRAVNISGKMLEPLADETIVTLSLFFRLRVSITFKDH